MGAYFDDHHFYLVQSAGTKEITNWISEPQAQDDLDALSVEVSCTVLRNDRKDKWAAWPGIECGDKLVIRNLGSGKEVFSGIILEVGQDGVIRACDPGWYLSKSEIILQCNTVSARAAVEQMCAKAGIVAGTIDLPATVVNKEWFGATPETILEDILAICSAETGKQYKRRVTGGKLNITPLPESAVRVFHKPAANLAAFDISWAKGEITGTDSMEDMVNRYVLTADSSSAAILGTAEDPASIARYGLLQQVESLGGDENAAQAKQRLKTLLAENNRITKERTVSDLWGADEVESGTIIQFVQNQYDVSGPMRVKNVTHRYGRPHLMSVTVEAI